MSGKQNARIRRLASAEFDEVILGTAQCSGLPPTGPGNHRSDVPKAGHALTFKLDQSIGADQVRSQWGWKSSSIKLLSYLMPRSSNSSIELLLSSHHGAM